MAADERSASTPTAAPASAGEPGSIAGAGTDATVRPAPRDGTDATVRPAPRDGTEATVRPAPRDGTEATFLSSKGPAADATVSLGEGRTPTFLGAASRAEVISPAAVFDERYQMLRELARGGMGRVVIAYDRHLQREVAIKEMLADDAEMRARFEREILMTARLQHPGIVSIYESGASGAGKPYYVMRQIPGRPLGDLLAERPTFGARLTLLPNLTATVEALAYAHQQCIIHRDLKPANVMVGQFGETVVIDWGLAKRIGDAEASEPHASPQRAPATETGLTLAGAVMGTPAYMSPEQARGETVDAGSDVYALGAMLRHLVTGEAPYLGDSVQMLLGAVLAGPPRSLELAAPDAPPDLVAIANKAMAYRPEERYRTAADLAEDLRRFELGKLVGARQYTALERVGRWIRRHRAVFSVAASALVVLIAGGVLSVRHIMEARRAAEVERDRAERARANSENERQRALLDEATLEARHDPTGTVLTLRKLNPSLGGWDHARLVAEDALSQGVASYALEVPRLTFLRAMSNGERVALGTEDGDLDLWERGEGAIHKLGNLKERVMWIDARDDRLVAYTRSGHIEVWDARARSRLATIDDGHALLLAGLLGDGNVFFRRLSGEVILWDLKSGRVAQILHPHGDFDSLPGVTLRTEDGRLEVADSIGAPRTLAVDPDWTFVDGTAQCELLQSDHQGLALFNKSEGQVHPLPSSDGLQVVSAELGSDDVVVALTGPRTFRRWTPGAAEPSEGTVDCDARRVEVLPDGTAAFDCPGVTELIDREMGRRFLPSANDAFGVSLASGDLYLTRPRPGEVLVWEMSKLPRTSPRAMAVAAVGIDAEHRHAWAISHTPPVLGEVDLGRGIVEGSTPLCAGASHYTSTKQGAAYLCDAERDNVRLLPSGRTPARTATIPGASDVQLGDQGPALVVHGDGLSTVEPETGAVKPLAGTADVTEAFLFADGKLLAATRGSRGPIQLIRTSGEPAGTLPSVWRSFVRLTHQRDTLVWGEQDGTMHVWSEAEQVDHAFNLHGPIVGVADLSPDGRRLVGGDWEGNLLEWEVGSGKLLQQWGGQGRFEDIAVTADGRRALVTGSGGSARLVDLTLGAAWALSPPEGAPSAVVLVNAPPEVLTLTAGTIRLWDDGLPLQPEAILDRLRERPQVAYVER